MTAEEVKLAEERIQKYQQLDSRIKNLQGAITHLTGDKLAQLMLDFEKGQVEYRDVDFRKDVLSNICWAKGEEGIMEEIKSAICTILNGRAATYIRERDAV